MTLYNLCAALEQWEPVVDETTGEILNAAELDQLEMDTDTKAENIALYIKNLRAEAEAIKAEIDALSRRKRAKDNLSDRLTQYLADCLSGRKIETARVKISYRKSESVEADVERLKLWSAENLDLGVIRTKMLVEPDKTVLKKLLKSGMDIDGAQLVIKNNLTIK